MSKIEVSSPWIAELLCEAGAFDRLFFPPQGDVKDGEEIIGICSEEAARFWSYSRHCEREAKLLSVDLEYSPADTSEQDKKESLSKIIQFQERQHMSMHFLGIMLREQFNGWGDGTFYELRSDWRVVKIKPHRQHPLMHFMIGGQPPQE